MIPIEGEKNLPKYLCDHARQYCEKVGAIEIYNLACLGDGDYRIMYWIPIGEEKRKMEAVILKVPEQN
jgi:hypothetical protein